MSAKSTKKKQKPKSGGVFLMLIRVTCVLISVAAVVSIYNDKTELMRQQAIYDELLREKEELTAQNSEYESILNETDERSYMERIAIEIFGYAYPSERRFYDTTRN